MTSVTGNGFTNYGNTLGAVAVHTVSTRALAPHARSRVAEAGCTLYAHAVFHKGHSKHPGVGGATCVPIYARAELASPDHAIIRAAYAENSIAGGALS